MEILIGTSLPICAFSTCCHSLSTSMIKSVMTVAETISICSLSMICLSFGLTVWSFVQNKYLLPRCADRKMTRSGGAVT